MRKLGLARGMGLVVALLGAPPAWAEAPAAQAPTPPVAPHVPEVAHPRAPDAGASTPPAAHEPHGPPPSKEAAVPPPSAAGKAAPGAASGKTNKDESKTSPTDEAHAAKEGGKPEKPVRRADRAVPEDPARAPSLSVGALREELRRGAGTGEPEDPLAQRERLEKLNVALEAAREELRRESASLQALIDKAKAAPPPAAKPETGRDKTKSSAAETNPALAAGALAKLPLDQLAKAVRGMKPAEAAPIVERLSRPLAADVLARMPPADAGKVLGKMRPEPAAELVAEMASRQPGRTGETKK